ncbi:hypothetical protein GLOIN_2v1847221 [Rhizophagus irregularis DAOM 181602=DAOM 197198]|uniref:Uncharacterized protein n=1 Tax=Rhizophagus irregularis (strain DAOM 181602 / DAOM 197198 / MUCL 43194) TaxID=747089 RepID=A0A2P4P6T4_RHIID|nr:hypothetical protein GLOIN_2v1847221 [Rhizophagus irregularis DAOM 181602=DAOM 197198]POG61109.1 hypothetical protein GLOIN_2v1847221 [Rhizophagus irregularis DAOM 181602=DAOM 197198]|eukprot:XP_025167975.1 hypothetical protein GLOIN_2v1847221 [Rhizophagus irregularis DAOM 181602=DAOM 197198]
MDDNLGLHHGFLFGCIVLNQVYGIGHVAIEALNHWDSVSREIPTWKNRISNIVNKKISDVDAGFSSEYRKKNFGKLIKKDRTLMKRCLITVTSFILLFSFDLIIRILSMITSRLKDGFHKWIGWKWISGSWVDWMEYIVLSIMKEIDVIFYYNVMRETLEPYIVYM